MTGAPIAMKKAGTVKINLHRNSLLGTAMKWSVIFAKAGATADPAITVNELPNKIEKARKPGLLELNF
jgi:hypothetical protein